MYSTKGKRGKSKPLKDPEAPKKPLSSFIHFCMKERSNVQKELLNTDRLLNCNTVSAKVTKELGKRWATLDSEMRKVYEEASLKDRKRYEMEKKMYNPSKEFLKKKAEFEGAPKFSSIKSPIPKATETVADHFEDYFNFLHINWLGDNCQILAVRSDNCQIGQLSVETTVSGDNCQWANCQWKL